MIGRRTVLFVLVLGALSGPRAVGAQPPPPGKSFRIGYLSFRSGPSHLEEAFRQGLRELGYVEGRNISVEYRWAEFDVERVPALAEELVRLNVAVIVSTGGNATALAVKNAVKTIPIVFSSGDPVRGGLVPSLDRPGGNLTGINLVTTEINAKRLELLKAAVPRASRVAVLMNPTSTTAAVIRKDLDQGAGPLQVKLQILEARGPQDLDAAFEGMVRERAGALLVVSDPMLFGLRERVVGLVSKHRLPAIFEWREFAELGGLMSYGANIADMYRRLAGYVDKILKGAKPGDLPIEQPTTYELVINAKTAKALGLAIPQPCSGGRTT